jgi:hypothetical protein
MNALKMLIILSTLLNFDSSMTYFINISQTTLMSDSVLSNPSDDKRELKNIFSFLPPYFSSALETVLFPKNEI